jgi:hypothetical protein
VTKQQGGVEGKGIHVFRPGSVNLLIGKVGIRLRLDHRTRIRIHLSSSCQFGTLRLGFTGGLQEGPSSSIHHSLSGNRLLLGKFTHDEERNSHQSQQFSAFLVVLFCRLDLSPGQLIDILSRSCSIGNGHQHSASFAEWVSIDPVSETHQLPSLPIQLLRQHF